ncbi:uncharacterized protein LOC130773836 [Actinidia eriantha]|uniref:uncharacterized protein LOC130773836 n=1 Tax=Actinidia eriantha TaxID=165200 RepID=UPI002585C4B5|nr:uncharacterized protein LOC130773836 [Actinidia eriantha]
MGCSLSAPSQPISLTHLTRYKPISHGSREMGCSLSAPSQPISLQSNLSILADFTPPLSLSKCNHTLYLSLSPFCSFVATLWVFFESFMVIYNFDLLALQELCSRHWQEQDIISLAGAGVLVALQNMMCGKNVLIDMSIHTTYVKAIRATQLENQYFIGSPYNWSSYNWCSVTLSQTLSLPSVAPDHQIGNMNLSLLARLHPTSEMVFSKGV